MNFETYKKDGQIVRIPIPQTFRDRLRLCQSDWYRLTGKIISPYKLLLYSILMPRSEKSILIWFRLASLNSKILSAPFRLLHRICSKKYNIALSPKTKIGYGFYIGHGMSIVINETTVIGNNVNISQFLNIGTNHETPALIADNVYIGPMCCIVEDVVIGENSVVGAGAVVTKNVPAGSTVAGVPARVLNYNPKQYIKNPFKFEE